MAFSISAKAFEWEQLNDRWCGLGVISPVLRLPASTEIMVVGHVHDIKFVRIWEEDGYEIYSSIDALVLGLGPLYLCLDKLNIDGARLRFLSAGHRCP